MGNATRPGPASTAARLDPADCEVVTGESCDCLSRVEALEADLRRLRGRLDVVDLGTWSTRRRACATSCSRSASWSRSP
jgi:hypothetical protein